MDVRNISMPGRLDPTPADDSILVAVNGGSSGWQAVDWAASETAAKGSALRIVHVVAPLKVMFDPLGGTGPVWIDMDASEAGALLLDQAVRRVRQIAPDTAVTTSLTCGTLSAAIRAAGRDHALTVVGRGKPRRFGIRSNSQRIARGTAGPVAIVELDEECHGGPSAGRVVLGIDDSAGPHGAVTYAFQAASRRGVGLTVIHASQRIDALRRLATIDDVLHIYRNAFPDVDVRRRFVSGSPGMALVAESRGAALLVVGARQRGRLPRVLGSIARSALGRAESPIAMISPSTPRHHRS